MHKVQDPKYNVDLYLLSNVMLEDVFALRIASTAPSTSSKNTQDRVEKDYLQQPRATLKLIEGKIGKQVTQKREFKKWEENQLYSHFRRQVEGMVDISSWALWSRSNRKRKTLSLLIAVQNTVINIHYINSEINRTQ